MCFYESVAQTIPSLMNQYFLFLRAINVGGHNMIKMADLTTWMQQLGISGIKTYLQSGNVIFQTSLSDVLDLSSQIKSMIFQKTKLNIPCIIRNHYELNRIYEILASHETAKPPNAGVFITLLTSQPSVENIEKLKAIQSGPDTFMIYGSDIVLICQQPYHKTKLSNNLFERILKTDATTRNFNTIQALLQLSM
jgi:uncharacterized protein (DUF1697 family)